MSSISDKIATLKANISSAISSLRENLTSKGVTVEDGDTLTTLVSKVNDIPSVSSNPNIYTVDLSIYNFSEKELTDAKAILDYNLVGIWETPEGQRILAMDGTTPDYNYDVINLLVGNNGLVRPVLFPALVSQKGNVRTSFPQGNQLYSTIYRGNVSYGGDVADDIRARNFDRMCNNNRSITSVPGGNWTEMAGSLSDAFGYCTSLKEVDLTLPVCTNVGSLLYTCDSLVKCRLIIPMVESSRQMFTSCLALKELYLDMPKNNRFDYTIERCFSLEKLTVIFGANIGNYNNSFGWDFPGYYMLLKNICMHPSATVIDLSHALQWGTGSDENRQSVIDTLITYSYDRVAAGYAPATVTLNATTKALLTESEITQINNKGYTIA